MSKINCQWTLVLRSKKSYLNGLKELTIVQYSSVRSVQPNAGEVLKLSRPASPQNGYFGVISLIKAYLKDNF